MFALFLPFLAAAQPQPEPAPQVHWYDRFTSNYQPSTIPPVSFDESPRLENLLRAGKLYLSLQDAIALALENNLDVQFVRYSPAIAQSDLERARGGASTLRGLNYSVSQPPPGVGGPASPLLNLPASGPPTTSIPTSLNELTAIQPSQISAQIIPGPYSGGPAVPLFDPAVIGGLNWLHQTTPETNSLVTGTPTLTAHGLTSSLGIGKGFGLGTDLSLNFNSSAQTTNSSRSQYNPYSASSLGFNVTQPLLRGFGLAVNRRFIRIARNNERASDLIFRQQVIETVSGVVRLYFDLVSLGQDVAVKQQTLALAQRLYEDNRQKVEQGTLAPIELVRAQAQVAAARQDLANSDGFELQQELIVKTVLTRRGTADPRLRDARIIASTPLEIPEKEEIRPIQDLVEQAYRNRPELEGGRLQIDNSRIALDGSRNALLPDLNVVGILQNSGLGGQFNPQAPVTGLVATPDTSFLGGFGSSLGQIFRNNYPTYGVGIQLNLPLKNRVAQGDYARDTITLRQTEIRLQQLQNQVRLEVEGAIIATRRARAACDAAIEARKLQEQSLQIEMEKYDNGLSTNFLVMQYQSYVAQARSTEVASKDVYIKARIALERAIGETLAAHNVDIGQVYKGKISAPPAAPPEP